MSDNFQILAGYILPHPPVIVPGVSHTPHKAEATVRAMRQLADDLGRLQPETVVVISPHAPLFSDYIYFYDAPELEGGFSSFAAPKVRLSFRQDDELCHDIISRLPPAGLEGGSLSPAQMRQHQIGRELDHGVLVPLWYLREKAPDFRLVALSCSGLPLPKLYQLGELIRQSAARLNRRVVVVASGDQSHKVNSESPYGSVPEGAQYDNLLVDCLRRGDLVQLLGIDDHLRDRAAECGYRSIVILCGAYNRQAVKTSLENYEAPYGIGYCVAVIRPDPGHPEPVEDALMAALFNRRSRAEKGRQKSQPPVIIAQETLEAHVLGRPAKRAKDFADLPGAEFLFRDRAGAFVSLKKFGELRGCIGTTAPTTASLVDEIIQNAISAGCHDPRFDPVEPGELPDLVYSVDILGKPEPVEDPSQLDPARYGVIVRSGGRSGLLLPDLEGVDTVEEQLSIACRKGGIRKDEKYQILRFQVTRYT
jgi:MEMO1 family protein